MNKCSSGHARTSNQLERVIEKVRLLIRNGLLIKTGSTPTQ